MYLLEMQAMFTIFMIIGVVMFIVIFSMAIMMIFGTKLRSKILSNQFKTLRNSTDMSKEDIEAMLKNLSDASISSRKKIYEEKEDDLKDIADANARINKDAVRETSSAIKEGFMNDDKIYCKHCGSKIDSDSKFCKSCGMELK